MEDRESRRGREGLRESLEVSDRSNTVTNTQYVPEAGHMGGLMSSNVSGHMTPDSLTEPAVTEPQQLEHIADREGNELNLQSKDLPKNLVVGGGGGGCFSALTLHVCRIFT